MVSLLTDPLFESSGHGPSPNKNYYHVAVTKSDVTWRWWKISPRAIDRYSKPGELKEPHQDFLDDTWLQNLYRNALHVASGEVSMVFGRRILQYTKALCQGHYDYLEHLSDTLLLRIINHLELEDVGQLGRTSRKFRKLCGSEEFWEQAVKRRCNTVSAEVTSVALVVGWRSVFFTSKLQLQKLISRRRLKAEEHQEGPVSDPDAKAEESPDESSETDQTSGSEEDSHFGIISDLCLGTDPGTRFDSSACCDIDPDPNPESEVGSDSTVPVPCQLFEDIKHCVVEMPLQKSALNNSRGDCHAEPGRTMS